ncbi:UDP-3-O-(3-hydroxymyristoyl)glucosamine N-acyltransferase [Gammaproteobacteria bacterium]|nr:UDP-3-O-(3-hydroxymyristoyl)glucosamine N-acyltransferase [Gammaproteobacteria bacterium]MDA9902681.1 UDP-3-O-(3-hydroxymyristoyl)glucosamine N-acyltransferase [Gammaproteobacteria bacterium]MDB4848764.1 UDP-3-O-(3-hydroxymyristoyl)glucosamine N-acyltransferase [Gammaproteobacteria bacterium]MDC0401425.1 UDP-3-O-(3-hydroxymyristoyl)glucosamine N-acyltransferase [Gammaproteobacteria bacterium]MDC1074109.1 UDP-3-O-(3-hydroxymyristoyl)glucosamine N-acyltransferase [Gammaproteobacteria bacterium
MSQTKEYTLSEIAEFTGSKIVGNKSSVVNNIATLQNATKESISFLTNKKYQKYIKTTSANAVIVATNFKIDNQKNYLVSEDPYLAYAKLTTLFKKPIFEFDNPTIHPSAVISNRSQIGNDVSIGANVVIGPDCIIGNHVIIKANCSIVQDVVIGEYSVIHNGSVLGSDGFGYAPSKDGYIKIEQLGKLVIGKDVEIGASCTIDRGALDNTEIHDGVKLDNQIQIAHNVVLGENSAIAASCAIAGSTIIGKNFQMGGLSGVLGHLSVCDDVTVGAHTLITKSINKSGNYIGIMPAQNQKDWAKSSIFIKKRI